MASGEFLPVVVKPNECKNEDHNALHQQTCFFPSVVFSGTCVACHCLKCLYNHIYLDHWGPTNSAS